MTNSFPGNIQGDFTNYQPILSKVYFYAGLKQIASAGGFKEETLTALIKCSYFKHTYPFFLESRKAIHVHMLDVFTNTIYWYILSMSEKDPK